MADLTKCLYCPTTREQPFREAEHVIPQAFGTFESREGNLTLHNVCPECNGYFGRNLEQHFGRDTGEALLRLMTGLKPAEKTMEIGGRRLKVRIDRPGGEDHGALVTLGNNPEGHIVVHAAPQVALRLIGESEWIWFREQDITSKAISAFGVSEYQICGSVALI